MGDILAQIVDAFDVEGIKDNYPSSIEITDLKKELGTEGHVLVVRGDKAYADNLLQNEGLANPKFWMYDNLIKSDRVQKALREFPNHKLFDGVGFSSLEAIGFHATRLGRGVVVVMAHELLPDTDIHDRWDIEIVNANPPAEEGYIKKQSEIIQERSDIIPLHQALYGPRALAPIGNKVVQELDKLGIHPTATYWCIASGSNLYGIGRKIAQHYPTCETVVVEPEISQTIDNSIKLGNRGEVIRFARKRLRNYNLDGWDGILSGAFPLHAKQPNRYLLHLWAHTGIFGFDKLIALETDKINYTQVELQNRGYNWTKTTALTLAPAIEDAKQGKNVLVMAYGTHRNHQFRDLEIR